ncbi:MAG: biotin/lipoyl-binding protein [Saprospiraceae bacterium]
MKRMLMLAALVAFVCHTGCQLEEKEEGHAQAETKFLVTSPIKKDTTNTKEYVCQIRSIRNIEVRALEGGYLQKILVDEGQFVKEGQLLFQVMPKLYEAEVNKAKAEARVAEIEYLNTKLLADSNVVSKMNWPWQRRNLKKPKPRLSCAGSFRIH